jgi:hypothetical protein
MLRRPILLSLLVIALLGLSGVIYAQLETADRGILPLDTSNTLEIGGIHVDVAGADAQSARYAGWRMAQRQGFKALWAKMHNAPISQAPSLPDGTLDQIVSSINIEREQIGPLRYIADLGVLFDRARAAQFLGVEGGKVERSAPMLLIPVTVSGGTATRAVSHNSPTRAYSSGVSMADWSVERTLRSSASAAATIALTSEAASCCSDPASVAKRTRPTSLARRLARRRVRASSRNVAWICAWRISWSYTAARRHESAATSRAMKTVTGAADTSMATRTRMHTRPPSESPVASSDAA